VTVNFRSNIFGFPNAPHLAEQNLGLADMRLSLEWVEENIVKLGGHPSNIVVWGQSAGAIALDYLNFAYPSNPIASGMILDSSTALYPQAAARSFDTRQRNFTAVAASLGCNNTSSQLGCMRNVSWQAIEAALSADSTLSFIPVVDNVLLFENFTQRYEMGALSHIPAFIGSNLHEFNEGAPNVLSETFNQSVSDAKTDAVFLCTAAQTSKLRQTQGRITYRYRFDGNFSNISPSAYPGAYHASELPLVFGTAGDFHRPSTAYEEEVSRAMQDLWLDFAKNPEHGLNKSGFGPYGMGKAMLLGDVGVPVKEVDISQVDGVCSAIVAVL
jgi:carboxylesterase type B